MHWKHSESNPGAGNSNDEDSISPWVHSKKPMSFELNVDRATACQAVASSLTCHALAAVNTFAELLLTIQSRQQDGNQPPTAMGLQKHQRLQVMVGTMLAC